MADLRARHPALFLPPEPEPESAPEAADEARDSSLLSGAYEMKAATARFVETQSERARSLAERSSEQGRVLAQSAAGRFATLRTSLRGGSPVPRRSGPTRPRGKPGGRSGNAWNSGPGRVGESLRDGFGRLRATGSAAAETARTRAHAGSAACSWAPVPAPWRR